MKKFMLTILGVFGAHALLAEGTTPTMDTTAAAGLVEQAQTGLSSLLTTVTPYISTIVLAGLAIWAAMVIIRLVKRAFSRAA